jgi:hypothetical protein
MAHVGIIMFSFSSLDSRMMLLLYLDLSLAEYIFVVCSFVASAHANKLERIQPKFTTLCRDRVFVVCDTATKILMLTCKKASLG